MTTLKTGLCRLCDKEKKLHHRSHIIPEAFYRKFMKNTFDDHLLMVALETGKKLGKAPKYGKYDRYFYCDECEKLFSDLDQYGRRILLPHAHEPVLIKLNIEKTIDGEAYYLQVNGLNYNSLKRFFISIILRCHNSDQFGYTNFSFPKNQIKLIKQLLLENQEIPIDVFPITILGLKKDKNSAVGIPFISKNSAIWIFDATFVSLDFPPIDYKSSAFWLQKDGSIKSVISEYSHLELLVMYKKEAERVKERKQKP